MACEDLIEHVSDRHRPTECTTIRLRLRRLAGIALALACLATAAAPAAAAPAALSRAGLLAAGGDAPLDARTVTRSARWNDRRWTGAHRRQVLAWLRGAPVAADAHFEASDVHLIARLQRGAGIDARRVDGRFGKATAAIALMAGLELAPQSVSARRVELWFYPGSFEDLDGWKRARELAEDTPVRERYRAVKDAAPTGGGLIYVVIGDNVVDVIDARGGPPFSLASGSHSADPSKPGRYRLGEGKAHRTDNWIHSQIPWGAALRDHNGEIQFRAENRGRKARWAYATGPKSALTYPIPREDFYDDDGALHATWRFNDFGARAWRLRGSPGLLIHTTPGLERASALGVDPSLPTSHGCLHVKPSQRDRLVERGYLRRGVTVVIKRYRDRLLPRKVLEKVARHRGA